MEQIGTDNQQDLKHQLNAAAPRASNSSTLIAHEYLKCPCDFFLFLIWG